MDNPCMTLIETSKALHLRLDTLMAWIQEEDKSGQPVCPFGKYIKKPGKTHGHYIIIRVRFEKYMNGEDMVAHQPNRNLYPKEDDSYHEKSIEEEKIRYRRSEQEKAIIKEINLSDNWKLRKYCENSQLYYTTQDIYRKLAPCQDIPEYCRKGIVKGINSDGHKWFIEKEAFNNMDPELFPERCRKRYIKYFKKNTG